MSERVYEKKWRLLLEENVELYSTLKRISNGQHNDGCSVYPECDEVCPRRIAREALERVARIPAVLEPSLRCKRHNSIVCRCDVAPAECRCDTIPVCGRCGDPSPNGHICERHKERDIVHAMGALPEFPSGTDDEGCGDA